MKWSGVAAACTDLPFSRIGACRLNDADTHVSFGTALDSMCSQLASAGVYINTVLQSTSALLHALCKPEAAALLAAIPQACKNAGPSLTDSCSLHQLCCLPCLACRIATRSAANRVRVLSCAI